MLQDRYLDLLRQTKTPVTIYLVTGMKLQGTIESFDRFTIQLRGVAPQFIYKSAISTLVPSRDVSASIRGKTPAAENDQP